MYYVTVIPVRASGTALWRAVSSVAQWPQWTPTVEEVALLDGELRMGARVRIRQPKLRTLVYRVDEWINGTRFVWSAGGPGFRVSAGHIVQPGGEESSLMLTLTMTGPLAPLLAALIGRRSRRYVRTEGQGLARFAEHLAAGGPPAGPDGSDGSAAAGAARAPDSPAGPDAVGPDATAPDVPAGRSATAPDVPAGRSATAPDAPAGRSATAPDAPAGDA